MHFISEIRQWYKLWSVQISFVGMIWTTFADQITNWWNLHAVEYFPFMPPLAIKWIGLIFLISGVLARLVKQEKLNATK